MPLPHFTNPGYSNQNTPLRNKALNEERLCSKLLELLELDSDTLETKDAWIRVYRELKLKLVMNQDSTE